MIVNEGFRGLKLLSTKSMVLILWWDLHFAIIWPLVFLHLHHCLHHCLLLHDEGAGIGLVLPKRVSRVMAFHFLLVHCQVWSPFSTPSFSSSFSSSVSCTFFIRIAISTLQLAHNVTSSLPHSLSSSWSWSPRGSSYAGQGWFPPGREMLNPSPFVETRLGVMNWLEMLSIDLLILTTMILRGGGPFSGPTMDCAVDMPRMQLKSMEWVI